MANNNEPVSVPAVKPDAPVDSAAVASANAVATPADGWWNSKANLAMVLGGSLLTVVGGIYGYQSIGKGTPRAVAQNNKPEPQVVTPPSAVKPPEEPNKLNIDITDIPPITPPKSTATGRKENLLIDDLPDVKAPPVPGRPGDIVIEAPTIKIPTVKAPSIATEPPEMKTENSSRTIMPPQPIIRVSGTGGTDKTETSPPPKIPTLDIDAPPIVSPPSVSTPTISVPPTPGTPTISAPPLPNTPTISVPPTPGTPTISAPPLPNTPTISPPSPVKKDEVPMIKTDIEIPPPPAALPGIKLPESPKSPTIKDDGIPIVPPTPMIKVGNPDPMIPAPPAPPTIKIGSPDPVINPPMPKPLDPKMTLPPIEPEPRRTPGIDVAPPTGIDVRPMVNTPKAPVEPAKREEFDEDWHTPRSGETYLMISKEYYKTGDYAQALEAYNRDKGKNGEKIIRVPPVWVLEDKYPNLTGSNKPDNSATPKQTNPGISYESVDNKTIGSSTSPSRPAPPPAISTVSNVNDEYRVQAQAGESIRMIARKLYGDENAWRRIWDMNPKLDPTQPIPVGTTLRLPR